MTMIFFMSTNLTIKSCRSQVGESFNDVITLTDELDKNTSNNVHVTLRTLIL